MANNVIGQSITISGTVRSRSDDVPLPGVTISIVGSVKAFKTDDAGKFTIISGKDNVALFSFVGYRSQRVTLRSSDSAFNIVLDNAGNSLNEVVVTALGISKQKKSLGYSVQELKSKDFSEHTGRQYSNGFVI